MALAGAPVTKDIPHEPGCTITFKQLGYWDLKRSQEEAQRQGNQRLREMGGEIYQRIVERRSDGRIVDPINLHDQNTLLLAGVLDWSGPGYGDPVNAENLRRLDPVTAEWAERQILDLAGVPNAWGEQTGAIESTAIEVSRSLPEGKTSEDVDSPLPSWSGSSGT